MMHFMGFDLPSERESAAYGQLSEEENDDHALFGAIAGSYF